MVVTVPVLGGAMSSMVPSLADGVLARASSVPASAGDGRWKAPGLPRLPAG